MALADDVGKAGALDRLHESILIAARHPDERRAAQRGCGVRVVERDLRRFARAGVEPHLHGADTGVDDG
jgi:hypothetical protein